MHDTISISSIYLCVIRKKQNNIFHRFMHALKYSIHYEYTICTHENMKISPVPPFATPDCPAPIAARCSLWLFSFFAAAFNPQSTAT